MCMGLLLHVCLGTHVKSEESDVSFDTKITGGCETPCRC